MKILLTKTFIYCIDQMCKIISNPLYLNTKFMLLKIKWTKYYYILSHIIQKPNMFKIQFYSISPISRSFTEVTIRQNENVWTKKCLNRKNGQGKTLETGKSSLKKNTLQGKVIRKVEKDHDWVLDYVSLEIGS